MLQVLLMKEEQYGNCLTLTLTLLNVLSYVDLSINLFGQTRFIYSLGVLTQIYLMSSGMTEGCSWFPPPPPGHYCFHWLQSQKQLLPAG